MLVFSVSVTGNRGRVVCITPCRRAGAQGGGQEEGGGQKEEENASVFGVPNECTNELREARVDRVCAEIGSVSPYFWLNFEV